MMRSGIAAFALVLGAGQCLALPVSVEAIASADAFVRSMDPDHNYGGAGGLAVSGSAAVNADGEQMGLLDTLIRFDVSSAVETFDAELGSGNWDVTKVVLKVKEQGAPNHPIYNRGVGQFEARWIAADDWVEGTGYPREPTTDGVTYSDLPSLLDPAADVALGIFWNSGQDGELAFDFDLPPSFVSDLVAAGDVSLFLTAASDSIGFQFGSTKNSPPTLVITASAVPVVVNPQIAPGGPGTATVTWSTTDRGDVPLQTLGAVHYKPVGGQDWGVVEEAAARSSHSLQMTGLLSGANYAVVIVNDGTAEQPVYYPQRWPIPGDANLDCKVNILDMIVVRNLINRDASSGENWKADVNDDSKINILDMIFVRNHLNTMCE